MDLQHGLGCEAAVPSPAMAQQVLGERVEVCGPDLIERDVADVRCDVPARRFARPYSASSPEHGGRAWSTRI